MPESSEIGVLFFTDALETQDFSEYARRLEDLGVDTLWLPELFGREPFAAAGFLLAKTERLRVGTGIANVYVRDATASAAAARTLAELSGGRFSLGLGVSNVGLNTSRGHRWEQPLPKLQAYFDGMEKNSLLSVAPAVPAPVYVAAHGPGLLKFAAQRTDGVLTYLMTPVHTERARKALGDGKALHVAQMVLACEAADEARRMARKAVTYYVGLDYYRREWRLQGFEDADFEGGGSDRLIDSLVAWGSPAAIRERLSLHRRAGASQLIVIPLNVEAGSITPDYELLANLTR